MLRISASGCADRDVTVTLCTRGWRHRKYPWGTSACLTQSGMVVTGCPTPRLRWLRPHPMATGAQAGTIFRGVYPSLPLSRRHDGPRPSTRPRRRRQLLCVLSSAGDKSGVCRCSHLLPVGRVFSVGQQRAGQFFAVAFATVCSRCAV